MTPEEREIIRYAWKNNVRGQQFLEIFHPELQDKTSLVLQRLEEAYEQKDCDDVEYALDVAWQGGISPLYFEILCKLSDADWHHKHEDVVTALEVIGDARCVDTLERAAHAKHEYLAFDDARALGVKATWALYKIGTPGAMDALRRLCASDEGRVADEACARLRMQAERANGDV
jgi:hypothetical protein